VDVVVKGRHTEISERFRAHTQDKLARVAKLDGRCARIDVEVSEEHNPRQSGQRCRVELACHSRRAVLRAEAAAADPYAALDLAVTKLEAQLRRAADRRRVHHGARTPLSVAAATAGAAKVVPREDATG
jgi:ribosomal subunit interface protein